jgi:hypothetical protein
MPILTHEAELVRFAWSEYAAALHGLVGSEYERAEQEAWDQLQDALTAAAGGSLLPSDPIG